MCVSVYCEQMCFAYLYLCVNELYIECVYIWVSMRVYCACVCAHLSKCVSVCRMWCKFTCVSLWVNAWLYNCVCVSACMCARELMHVCMRSFMSKYSLAYTVKLWAISLHSNIHNFTTRRAEHNGILYTNSYMFRLVMLLALRASLRYHVYLHYYFYSIRQ